MIYPSKVAPFQRKWRLRELHWFLGLSNTSLMTNYLPISVLLCFSKMLERIMYHRLCKYLTENNGTLSRTYKSLVSWTNKSVFWKERIYSWCVWYLSKAFDTADHQILLKRLEYYGIAGNNLSRFENYLKDRKQFISFEHNSAKKATVTCGVPQGLILGPLLFLLYVNDLHHTLKILNPIMLVGNTNLFYSHSDINLLFEEMNKKLANSTNHQKKIIFRCGFRIWI